jgi:DNA polymerase III subunit epsilon
VLDTLVLARRMHPGQRNSLDALCKRYGIDNSQREYHGALLDARILADVYLAMTGGQEKLSWGAGPEAERDGQVARSAGTPAHDAAQRRCIPVVTADDPELAAHEAALLRLDKASGGNTVWRRA